MNKLKQIASFILAIYIGFSIVAINKITFLKNRKYDNNAIHFELISSNNFKNLIKNK